MKYSEDQKFYTLDGQLKAEIDVCLTVEHVEGAPRPPSIKQCRHAVLQIQNGSSHPAYVIYDRLLNRIVNGVYYMALEEVLLCAQDYNENPYASQDMAPNGVALALKYPKVSKRA